MRLNNFIIYALVTLLSSGVSSSASLANADPDVWQRQIIYLLLPDRFHNGDSKNDQSGQADCFDRDNPRKFHGGDLAGLRQKLGYVQALGATAIWITPLYKQVPEVREAGQSGDTACGYHGYWPDFTDPPETAIEPKLGKAVELKMLISDIHARHMKFISDMVVNHAGYGAKIANQHPDWFHQADTCHDLGDPDIYCPFANLPDFKQELGSGEVTDYLVRESASWVSQFAIDGIRMDTASHVPPWFFRDRWIPAMTAIRPLFLLAEASPASSLAKLKAFIDDHGFDSVFNFPLRQAFVSAFAKGESVDVVASTIQKTIRTMGKDRALMLVNLVDNHDLPRFVSEIDDANQTEGRQRYFLALAALFTLPGIPQLYYGDELGLQGGTDPDNRRDMPAWAWTPSGRSQFQTGVAFTSSEKTFNRVHHLIEIRKNNPALYGGYYAEISTQESSDTPNFFAFFRGNGSNRVVTLINNGNRASDLIKLPIRSNSAISVSDRGDLADGTVMDDLLGDGATPATTLTEGNLYAEMPSITGAIYRPRYERGGSAVTLRVRAAAPLGESLFLSGNSPELGSWEPRLAIRMSPSQCLGNRCTWSVTLRYLGQGSSVEFKFLRKSSEGELWESGGNRSLHVPATTAWVYDGAAWRD
jgi:glycosidase